MPYCGRCGNIMRQGRDDCWRCVSCFIEVVKNGLETDGFVVDDVTIKQVAEKEGIDLW